MSAATYTGFTAAGLRYLQIDSQTQTDRQAYQPRTAQAPAKESTHP